MTLAYGYGVKGAMGEALEAKPPLDPDGPGTWKVASAGASTSAPSSARKGNDSVIINAVVDWLKGNISFGVQIGGHAFVTGRALSLSLNAVDGFSVIYTERYGPGLYAGGGFFVSAGSPVYPAIGASSEIGGGLFSVGASYTYGEIGNGASVTKGMRGIGLGWYTAQEVNTKW